MGSRTAQPSSADRLTHRHGTPQSSLASCGSPAKKRTLTKANDSFSYGTPAPHWVFYEVAESNETDTREGAAIAIICESWLKG